MGINVDNVIPLRSCLGSSLAGAAWCVSWMYYNSIDPLMGVAPA